MDIKYNNKHLISVEYPGTVVNVDKMIKTLGGEKEMFSIFNNSSKRLPLKFRPDDPFCKCAHGDRFNTTNMIIKVVKRTRKSATGELDVKYDIELIGMACTTYKFKAMADFQILPASYDSEHGCNSLLPNLVPTTLHPSSWLDEPSPLFITPLLYSRFDFPQNGYLDIQVKNPRVPKLAELPPNLIGRSRKKRAGFAIFSTFESTEACNKPLDAAINQLKFYPLEIEMKIKVERLFKERPIWSRNAIMARLNCERVRLKLCLSCVAYYFTNGPWRALWVKFGYDPRKNTSAKIYQIMDFRINSTIQINEDKQGKKRNPYFCLPSKAIQNQQRIATINTQDLVPINRAENDDASAKNQFINHEYFSGRLPTVRQCFYQLCDIHLDEVQALIHQNDGSEEFCHEKDGWCELGTLDKCRNIITADLLKTIKAMKSDQIGNS